MIPHWEGLEHLSPYWNALRRRHSDLPSTNTKIVISGDSLTRGGFISDARFRLVNLLPALSARVNLPNVSAVAYGYSGENASTLKTRMGEVLNANPSLVILRWGMNEASRTNAAFEADLREAIARLRNTSASPAGRSAGQMPIVLMAPNVANSPPHAITPARILEIASVMSAVAASTECAFFNTAKAFPDATNTPRLFDSYLTHPTAEFESQIAEAVAPGLFVTDSASVGLPTYFARMSALNVVEQVIVADQSFIDSGKVGDPKAWVRTSTDGSIRKNYAGIGYTYDKTRDGFIAAKPSATATLDEATLKWTLPPNS